MKFFKHISTMSVDPKMKRVIRKFGVDGYGLYNYILELIVRRLESESPLPELEENVQDIADDLHMDTVLVSEITAFFVKEGLFQIDEVTNRLVAHKVYKFLDAATTRSPEIRRMIKAYRTSLVPAERVTEAETEDQRERDNPGLSGAVQDSPGLSVPEQNRTEQSRTEQNRTDVDINTRAREEFHLKPHAVVADTWYQQYHERTLQFVMPSTADYKKAKELLDRGYEAQTLLQAMELYFDAENKNFPQWDKKQNRFTYQFSSFVANIDPIISAISARASPEKSVVDSVIEKLRSEGAWSD